MLGLAEGRGLKVHPEARMPITGRSARKIAPRRRRAAPLMISPSSWKSTRPSAVSQRSSMTVMPSVLTSVCCSMVKKRT